MTARTASSASGAEPKQLYMLTCVLSIGRSDVMVSSVVIKNSVRKKALH